MGIIHAGARDGYFEFVFVFVNFELAVGHSGGQWAGDSSGMKLRRKSLCWRYWM